MPPTPLSTVSVAVLRPGTLVTRVTLCRFGAKGNFVPEPGAMPARLSHGTGLGEPSQGVPRVTLPGGGGGGQAGTPQPICPRLAAGPTVLCPSWRGAPPALPAHR